MSALHCAITIQGQQIHFGGAQFRWLRPVAVVQFTDVKIPRHPKRISTMTIGIAEGGFGQTCDDFQRLTFRAAV
jgi:hypothetical protein